LQSESGTPHNLVKSRTTPREEHIPAFRTSSLTEIGWNGPLPPMYLRWFYSGERYTSRGVEESGSLARVDSLKKVTLAAWESDSLPHIRGNFDFLENYPKFLLNILFEYKGIERFMNSL
jgi:hypothetical protein